MTKMIMMPIYGSRENKERDEFEDEDEALHARIEAFNSKISCQIFLNMVNLDCVWTAVHDL